MIDSIISESRHKFVYFDGSEDTFSHIEKKYPAVIDSSDPIAVYVKDSGIPRAFVRYPEVKLDRDMIISYHNRYYEILIFSSIIDTLFGQIDESILNKRMKRVFELCSMGSKSKIKNVSMLREYLIKSKDMYKNKYYDYIKTGRMDFYDEIPIPYVIIDMLVPTLKECLGFNGYFSLLLEVDDNISLQSEMAINDYISSRCNGYLSVNILLSGNEWSYYYNSNGIVIERVHDYGEVNLRKDKIRKKSIHN